jgi:hypothetical protein
MTVKDVGARLSCRRIRCLPENVANGMEGFDLFRQSGDAIPLARIYAERVVNQIDQHFLDHSGLQKSAS